MASYKILPLRNEGIDLEKIENRVENMSALESSADLRSGTLPRSFQIFQGEMCYVEYAQEEETEVTTLDAEDKEIKVADMYPIIFLGNGYVAHDANLPNQGVETGVLKMVSNLLGTDIAYEPIELDDGGLDDVVKQANKVRKADFKPSSQRPKNVSARYLPGLQETKFWSRHKKEPLERAKVNLPDQPTHEISFYEEGKITIHSHKIPEEDQVEILRYITEEVVSNLDIDSFQWQLGGEY
jgi:hypothetical protein